MRCQFYQTPGEKEQAEYQISDPDVVFGCSSEQGNEDGGPLWFFVPVTGGAVRVGVCAVHCGYLEGLYGGGERDPDG